jgi:hypothetical protein
MSAFVKITCINTIVVDCAKFGNEEHFISFVSIVASRNGTDGSNFDYWNTVNASIKISGNRLVSIIANDCTPMLTKPYLQRSFIFSNIKQAISTAWDAEEVHVKWCLTWYSDFVAQMVVVESIKTQVLHFTTWQGNATFSNDDSHLICLVFCQVNALTFLV